MVGADLALAALINRCATVYDTAMPQYITFHEHTHITVSAFGGRIKDIDRAIAVRVADDYAVMQDLPQGATRTGSAFPVIPFFDPFSSFRFSYFANMTKLDINFVPGAPFQLQFPAPDPNVDVVVPYISEWAPHYASDSTDDAVHLLIDPTSRTGNSFYPSDVKQDPTSQLPSHVTMQDNSSDMTIGLDYSTVDGRWIVTHGTFSATQHAIGLTFKVTAETTYSDFAFPSEPPDPRLAGTPNPSPSASTSP
jgi:hypothetical protein